MTAPTAPSVPTARYDFTAPVPPLELLGRVHLIAIGGAGMSAVARLLLARGIALSGSDAADSPTLTSLRDSGARVHLGHDASHVAGVDTVVVSSAVSAHNVELAAARSAGLRVLHRSQALASLMGSSRRVAVAGANGKTTTTSMLAVALVAAGADPSFACGGEIAQLGTNAAMGHGPAFVVEADESDGSFLTYHPDVAVITNVQPDHLDFYGTTEAVEQAYAAFVETVTQGGVVITSHDDDGSGRLAAAARAAGRTVLTYGHEVGADLRVGEVSSHDLGTHSVFVHDGVERVLDLAVPGEHNVMDACGAYLAAVVGLGADPDAVLAGLAGFAGARRRFEVHGEVDGVTVVDDYAHNPAKVTAVVGTASEIVHRAGNGSLRVVFQPHLYSRTREFAADFAGALAPADQVVLLDVYGAREEPVEGVTCALVGDPLRALPGQRTVLVGPSREEAVAALADAARPGDLLLTIGAGDVTALAPLLVQALRTRTEGVTR